MIQFNSSLKLAISDVDETVADLYIAAKHEMIDELTLFLQEGRNIFFVTGQGLNSVQWRIIEHLPKRLRSHILIGHCSGAEVWGFDRDGNRHKNPFYSIYDKSVNSRQKKQWRDDVQQIIQEFNLQVFPTMPVIEFSKKTGNNPLSVMFEDRGPQITFEIVNGYD